MIDVSKPTYYKRIKIWKDVSLKDWSDWRWQIANAVVDVEGLSKIIKLSKLQKQEIVKAIKHSRFQLTPYYLSLINPDDEFCPIRLQAIPTLHEIAPGRGDIHDPLAEDRDSPIEGLVHRYPDRALFLVSEVCSMYCRFCTRRRHVLARDDKAMGHRYDDIIAYIRRHKEIRDVILSGGDALMLPVKKLEYIVSELRSISHIEVIRVASRTPCVLPQKVTDEVVAMLKKYQPIFFMTHFNHPYELTPLAREACAKINDAGIPLYNQSVLLRRVNSDPAIMKKLVHELLKARVRPYYIYQCDLAEGIEHFRTPVAKGIEIMEYLRGHTSGISIPTLVIDAPGGGGKIPIMPNYVLTLTDDCVVVRNYKGLMSAYINPRERDSSCSTSSKILSQLVSEDRDDSAYLELLEGKRVILKPITSR